MRSVLDQASWPLRRWLCDRLVGQHAYSRNVRSVSIRDLVEQSFASLQSKPREPLTYRRIYASVDPFDQETA